MLETGAQKEDRTYALEESKALGYKLNPFHKSLCLNSSKTI